MSDPSSTVLRVLGAMPDPELRTSFVGEKFTHVEASEALELFASLVAGAEAKSQVHRTALLHACQALHAPPMAQLRSKLAQDAADRALYWITRMLRDTEASPVRSPDRRAEKKTIEAPLGTRKSQARVAGRDIIARLLNDGHPQVVEILLNNPKIRAADVVRIASRRPVAAQILETIFRHPRWLQHYPVQSALAKNPDTPSPFVHCLLYQLRKQDLVEVANAGAADEPLKEHAHRLCADIEVDRDLN